MTAFRIGIDLGGTKIEAAALDSGGAMRLRRRIPTPADDYAGPIRPGAAPPLISEKRAAAAILSPTVTNY